MSTRTFKLDWVMFGGKSFGLPLAYEATGERNVYYIERGEYCKHRFYVHVNGRTIGDFRTLWKAKRYAENVDFVGIENIEYGHD